MAKQLSNSKARKLIQQLQGHALGKPGAKKMTAKQVSKACKRLDQAIPDAVEMS